MLKRKTTEPVKVIEMVKEEFRELSGKFTPEERAEAFRLESRGMIRDPPGTYPSE